MHITYQQTCSNSFDKLTADNIFAYMRVTQSVAENWLTTTIYTITFTLSWCLVTIFPPNLTQHIDDDAQRSQHRIDLATYAPSPTNHKARIEQLPSAIIRRRLKTLISSILVKVVVIAFVIEYIYRIHRVLCVVFRQRCVVLIEMGEFLLCLFCYSKTFMFHAFVQTLWLGSMVADW